MADLFLGQGWNVTIVDDLSSGKRENLPAGAEFHEIGLNSSEFTRVVTSRHFDVVVHLAAQVDVRKSVADPVADAHTNIIGTLNLLESLRRTGASTRAIFTSTGGVLYGDFNTPPNHEGYPKDPESPYAIAKLSIEYYLAYYSRVHGLEYAALRFGNVYGPRQDPHGEAGVVAIFCGLIREERPLTVFGDGLQTRDYVYVHDVARAVWLASTRPLPEKGRLDARGFNIGTGKGTSVLEIARLLRETSRKNVPIEFAPHRLGEQRESFINADKARELLGWAPEVTLAEGLAKTYAWAVRRDSGAAL